MKVLFVMNNLSSGGAQKLVTDLIIRLNKSYVKCDLLLLKNECLEVHREKLISEGINLFNLKANKYWSLENIIEINKIKKNYDLIHCHLFHSQYTVALANLFSKDKVPIVTTEHSTYNRRRLKIFRLIERLIYRQFSLGIAISEGVEDSLSRWLGQDIVKIKVVSNGIDLDNYCLVKSSEQEYIDYKERVTFNICMVGRLASSKNHKLLIDVITQLPSKFILILVGDGENIQSLKEYSKLKKVDHRIKFEGHQENVKKYLNKADLYVHSSHWEGFGLSVVEAMSQGLPVLASNVDGLKDIVEGTGMLFDNDDVEGLAKIIIELETNPEKLEDMKQKSIVRARQYDIDSTAEQYYELYKSVINTRSK